MAQGSGVWSVLFIFGWLVFGLVLWREKSCGGNYRKRSRPKECAGVESKGKGRDMERKRECGAIREKQGEDWTQSLLCVEC